MFNNLFYNLQLRRPEAVAESHIMANSVKFFSNTVRAIILQLHNNKIAQQFSFVCRNLVDIRCVACHTVTSSKVVLELTEVILSKDDLNEDSE